MILRPAYDKASVNSDQYLHTFLSYLFPEVERVHTHPDKVVRKLAEVDYWGYSSNYLLEAARPSPGDILYASQLYKRSNRESRQIGTVVSHYGVTSFELNDAGKGNLLKGVLPIDMKDAYFTLLLILLQIFVQP